MTNNYRLTLGSEADLLLQKIISELAEKVFSSNVYSGAEYDLSIFLAGYVYDRTPGEVHEWHKDNQARDALFQSYREEAEALK